MSRWFRHYAGMMRDPKFVSVAVRTQQPIERVLFVWGCILESAAETNSCGAFSVDAGELAYFLRCQADEVSSLLLAFEATGLTESGSVSKWKTRQYISDADPTAAERQRRKRERDRDTVTVTDVSRVTHAPHRQRQSTDTDKKKETDIRSVADATRPASDDFEKFKGAYPKRDGSQPWQPAKRLFEQALKRGETPERIIEAARNYRSECERKQIVNTDKVAQAKTWLNQLRWTDYLNGVEADEGRRAEQAAFMATKGYVEDDNGGWKFVGVPPDVSHETAA